MSRNAGSRADWKQLCSLLDDAEHAWPAVDDALAEDMDAWGALMDALDDTGVLAYLMTGDTGMELADALVELPRIFRTQPDLDDVTDTDDLDEAIIAADRILGGHDLRLLRLDDGDDDDIALVVVHVASTHAVIALTSALGHPATFPVVDR